MKGDGQTWAEYNEVMLRQLDVSIETRRQGNDAYQRWPLDTLVGAQNRIKEMQDELDNKEDLK